ncbi:dolichyl-phosphate beta-glucosyltransferase ALG5A-like [Papaver somniferum]|uniref:dolichyl-phosphate beta-glucosyltransferase ALG5A-like n=1 Tax=Papaver somniferum TaxID=3469 RepID=UPI000E705769|nr:dolichyl-phosphate beta-glucosyltransferase ALG5A-like [Papaver somniferum]
MSLMFEAFRRRSTTYGLLKDAYLCFEDPKSRKKIPYPSIFDPAKKYISLIIPAINEEQRLPSALDGTMVYLQQRATNDKDFSYKVVLVDDGSTDGTIMVASDFIKNYSIDNVRVILLGRNQGKGEAIRKGMLHSRGELILVLDADGTTKVNDLEKLETQIRAQAERQNHELDADSSSRISDIPIAAFGSRAHL